MNGAGPHCLVLDGGAWKPARTASGRAAACAVVEASAHIAGNFQLLCVDELAGREGLLLFLLLHAEREDDLAVVIEQRAPLVARPAVLARSNRRLCCIKRLAGGRPDRLLSAHEMRGDGHLLRGEQGAAALRFAGRALLG